MSNTEKQYKVYKSAIYLPDKDNPTFGYVDAHEISMDESLYSQFRWDRLNRLDFFKPRQHMILLSSSRDLITAFNTGFYAFQTLLEDFSEEAKQKWINAASEADPKDEIKDIL